MLRQVSGAIASVCSRTSVGRRSTVAAAAAALASCPSQLLSLSSLQAAPVPVPCRFFHATSSLRGGHAGGVRSGGSGSSGGGGETKRRKVTSTTSFSPQPRTSSMDPLGGELASAAPSANGSQLSLSAGTQGALLNPQRVSRGGSARAARMDKELHSLNKNRLNHSLAYYIDRCTTWPQLVTLLFEHMHHMTSHNWVRGAQRLVQLSPSRQLLDVEAYNRFGRVMVQLETRMHLFDQQGLMRLMFVPYHYLRQCLRQMRLAQEAALEKSKADPAGARAQRRAQAQATLAQQEAEDETRTINVRVRAGQDELDERYGASYGRKDSKGKKLRAKEHRAGRAFTSVQATRKESGSKGSAQASKAKRAW